MRAPGEGSRTIAERTYAGVLGKIIGVYLGRPVEGWAYQEIRRRLGQLDRYVADELGLPLVVADDDISGTFVFARSVSESAGEPTAADVGRTWLNQIIEDRTILWWGGLGRSTEHTAFLNLKRGIPAPRSGSIEQNGQVLAEQIGAQIFSDAFALMCPADPERAVRITKEAARVSHDGVAIEAAGFLAALRSAAFQEPDLSGLIELGRRFVASSRLLRVIDYVASTCHAGMDWREIRDWVDANYGYHRYPGPCHAISNLAMSLGALLGGGDDFGKAVMIAASVGFDTDSNAGTVGCLNGVRLGLHSIPDHLRRPVGDRMLVISADGGEAVSDAVLETRKILRGAGILRGEPTANRSPRFGFEFPGSTQGFQSCPSTVCPPSAEPVWSRDGLRFTVAGSAEFSTPTFLSPADGSDNFSTVASPTLYPGQTVRFDVASLGDLSLQPYVVFAASEGVQHCYGPPTRIGATHTELSWEVPSLGNRVPFRVGVRTEGSGILTLRSLDWSGAPQSFRQTGVMLESIWQTHPEPIRAWVSSAKNFEADFAQTFSVSHPDDLGVVTIGTQDWIDYEVAATVIPSLHRTAGLVARTRGHRRFVAAALHGGNRLQLLRQRDEERQLLAECDLPYQLDQPHHIRLTCTGARLSVLVDGQARLVAVDPDPGGGAAGFLVEQGAFAASDFTLTNKEEQR